MKRLRSWIYLLLWVGAVTSTPQFRLNLGQLFGAVTPPRNNDNNNNNQRIDPLQIAGGLFGNAVGQILNNTDVKIGPGGIQIQQANNQGGTTDSSEECGEGKVGVRSGVGSSSACDCWEVGTDYPGGDLTTRRNPTLVDSVTECQTLCQKTSGCNYFSYKRKRGRQRRQTNCWLKSSIQRKGANNGRISGPKSCVSIEIAPVDPKPSSCVTVGGGRTGSPCVFPFIYKDKTHSGCTLVDADDGKPWCSTLTDGSGNHVGGQGQWGHCPDDCEVDVDVNVVGSASNSEINKIPWIKNGNLPSIPTAALGAAAGVSQNDVKNKFFSLGLNQPNQPFQTCSAIGNSQGRCRHLHHCVLPAFFNFFTFLSNICIIQGQFIGVCCPESSAPVVSTTTTTTTPTPVAPTRECGVNAKRFSTRIVGGRPADPDEWPWLAALVRRGGSGSGQYCGATLISNTHVLTAAHCLEPFSKEEILVKLGEYDFSQSGETGDETFSVTAMKLHENYNSVTYENDIAIIRLDRPATFSNSIWPICLPDASQEFTNTRAFVIGWGTIYFGGPVSNTLQEVNVRVWDNSQCANNYATLDRQVTDTMLCAGETNRDSCQGDSGGPLNCMNRNNNKWELCGVVSWGAKCAEPDYPGVYTRTTKYLNWIQQNQI